MTGLPDLPSGVWRHYTGLLVQVLGYAADSTNGAPAGRTGVVYVGLTLDGAGEGPRMRWREAAEFHGQVESGGGTVPRFAYVGPSWTPAGTTITPC